MLIVILQSVPTTSLSYKSTSISLYCISLSILFFKNYILYVRKGSNKSLYSLRMMHKRHLTYKKKPRLPPKAVPVITHIHFYYTTGGCPFLRGLLLRHFDHYQYHHQHHHHQHHNLLLHKLSFIAQICKHQNVSPWCALQPAHNALQTLNGNTLTSPLGVSQASMVGLILGSEDK